MGVVVDRGDQSYLVSTDIEDRQLPDLVCAWEGPAQLCKRAEVRAFVDALPGVQRTGAVRVPSPEFKQTSSGDYVHKEEYISK